MTNIKFMSLNSNTTGVASGAGTIDHSGVHQGFSSVRVARALA